MPVLTRDSSLYKAQVGQRWMPQRASSEKAFHAFFEHTQDVAGDASSVVRLIKLPPGKMRLVGAQSLIYHSAFGAGRTLDIGHAAYENRTGAAIVADRDSIADALNVVAAGLKGMNVYGGRKPWIDFDSADGVTIQATVLGDSIPAGTTIHGFFKFFQLA